MSKFWRGAALLGLSFLGLGFGAKPNAKDTKSNYIEENERAYSRVHYAILDQIEDMNRSASESADQALKFPDGTVRNLDSIRKDPIFFRNVVCEQFRLENLKQTGSTLTPEDRVAYDTCLTVFEKNKQTYRDALKLNK